MKDLQELFESLGTDEIDSLAEMLDKKSLNPKSTKKFMDYVSITYCAEMGVDEAELSSKEMEKLVESFTMAIALYKNVSSGHMEINGRLKLTDGNSATFKLTPEGIKHVENMLRK